ncbi:hypothetical protein Mapa_012472 [Marchantia paleacea]|nr:hypothetical protein Mapa_012472 [Marchantia paleacea]
MSGASIFSFTVAMDFCRRASGIRFALTGMKSLFFTALVLVLSLGRSHAINSDGRVLLTFLHTVSADSRPTFSSWNARDSNPCNGWLGVTCANETGRVVNVTLHSLSLYGSIPEEFGLLDALEHLSLSALNLTGIIPLGITKCLKLKTLDLSSNGLTGNIPPALGLLTELRELRLNDNNFEGPLPTEIGRCTQLEIFYFYQNNISGTLPPELGSLSKLLQIRGGGNEFLGGPIPPEFGKLKNLTVMGFAATHLSGTIPPELGGMERLQNFALYGCNLTGSIPKELADISTLQALYLHRNRLSGSIPPELGKLKQLTYLYLWHNELTGSIPPELSNCTSLQVLELSYNKLTGSIPPELGRLEFLQQMLLSMNNFTGTLPPELGNLSSLFSLQLDNNLFYGPIPAEYGKLSRLQTLFLWMNNFSGEIPVAMGNCKALVDFDATHNSFTGPLPPELFLLPNLLRLRLLSNNLTGEIPREIGKATNLVRLRLANNRFAGTIPVEIGQLQNLLFLDLYNNFLTGELPKELGNCSSLELIDAHGNQLTGAIPAEIGKLANLQIFDISENKFAGPIPPEVGLLRSLNQLVLSSNSLSGPLPGTLAQCQKLELLNVSRNRIDGPIPPQLGSIVSLVIGVDLSWNKLSGSLPPQLASLINLQLLDLSYNELSGTLMVLGQLDSLSTLNVSYNDFSGLLPDTYFFKTMPASSFLGNKALCVTEANCSYIPAFAGARDGRPKAGIAGTPLVVSLLFGSAVVILCVGSFLFYKRYWVDAEYEEDEGPWPWRLTPFQKLNFTLGEVLESLVEKNIVGSGCSGIVYKAEMDGGEVIAVKKLWPVRKGEAHHNSFAAEIDILGGIRHRNIVRLLGYCSNNDINLLMYDYMPNGSLGEVLHEKRRMLDWETRYNIAIGAAQGLAYLHHDCLPAILHRDVKSNNILLGSRFEPYVADFGLAKLIDASNTSKVVSKVAGSYGYIAPEYGYTMKITDKSDVYSYGVVLLEILTGRKAVEPGLGENWHIVKWVQEMINQSKCSGNNHATWEVIDSRLRCMPDAFIQEMSQALGVALLCVNSVPAERPTMKEVVALLLEVKHDPEDYTKTSSQSLIKHSS